mmetsp:Transcript_12925/g.21281  ORF Transcript_12925/g.21281 Transcript_12925/m.21281 type:complete len:103 (-) Transcript_12925:471-779(-)
MIPAAPNSGGTNGLKFEKEAGVASLFGNTPEAKRNPATIMNTIRDTLEKLTTLVAILLSFTPINSSSVHNNAMIAPMGLMSYPGCKNFSNPVGRGLLCSRPS